MQVACKVQNTRQCSATVLVWVEDGDNSFTRLNLAVRLSNYNQVGECDDNTFGGDAL